MKEPDILENLIEDLKPIRPFNSPWKIFTIWTIGNTLFLILAITYSGNLRVGWTLDLLHNGRFLLEFICGIAVSTISGFFLFKHAIPDVRAMQNKGKFLPVVILIGFTALLTISVFLPAKMPAPDGHRSNCIWQLLGFSIPPLLVLLYHLGRSAPVNLMYVGFLAGVAASAPFATAMHLACMYDPRHILVFHIFPVIVLSLVTAVIARLWIKWWR